MRRALEEYQVLGIKTTIPFYERVMQNPAFLSGNVTTSFIDEIFSQQDQTREHPLQDVALIAAAIAELESSASIPVSSQSARNAWKLFARKEGLRS